MSELQITRVDYFQDIHTDHPCGYESEHGTLSVAIMGAEDSEYIVINAAEWAIDTREELQALHDVIGQMLDKCRASD